MNNDLQDPPLPSLRRATLTVLAVLLGLGLVVGSIAVLGWLASTQAILHPGMLSMTATCSDQSENCYIMHRLTQKGFEFETHETSDGALWKFFGGDWQKIVVPRPPAYAGVDEQTARSVDGWTNWTWINGRWVEL